jgi:hypothetical protein
MTIRRFCTFAAAFSACGIQLVHTHTGLISFPTLPARCSRGPCPPPGVVSGQAFTEPFQAVHFEVSRPHRGQMASAANLRLCLEGSSLVNTRQDREQDNDAVRCIPQVAHPLPARPCAYFLFAAINAQLFVCVTKSSGVHHQRRSPL